MLGEFLRYFWAVVSGRRDPLVTFLEPLTMGERYLRWGSEKGDLRDFRTGLDQLRLCPDAYAPMTSLILRKYACVGDLCGTALDRLAIRHQRIAATAEKERQERLYEKDVLEKNLANSRVKAERLHSEGSILKAKEERRITGEIESQLREVNNAIEESQYLSRLCESYDETIADASRFFQEMDQAIVFINACQRLPAELKSSLASHLQQRLDTYKARLDGMNPIKT